VVCNLVTTIGLAGDIARHLTNSANLQNDFLSGWHLVLYGGVTAVGLWLGLGAVRRGPAYIRSAACTAIGFGLLAFGGAFDAAWHKKFGTEAAIEALVSPPHLFVFGGLMFLLTSPIVILWRRPAVRLGWLHSIAVMVSAVSAVLVTMLFTGFLSPMSGGLSLQAGYVEPLVGESLQDYDQVRGLGIVVWTIVVLATAFVTVLARFRVKPGLCVACFFAVSAPALFLKGDAVSGFTTQSTDRTPTVIGFVAAGVAVELALLVLGRPALSRVGAVLTGAVLGLVLWGATFTVLAHDKVSAVVPGGPAVDLGVVDQGGVVFDPTAGPVGTVDPEDRLQWGEALTAGSTVLAGMVGAAVGALATLRVARRDEDGEPDAGPPADEPLFVDEDPEATPRYTALASPMP
jgi:hypothetical protein